jgi:hypothetical protein
MADLQTNGNSLFIGADGQNDQASLQAAECPIRLCSAERTATAVTRRGIYTDSRLKSRQVDTAALRKKAKKQLKDRQVGKFGLRKKASKQL